MSVPADRSALRKLAEDALTYWEGGSASKVAPIRYGDLARELLAALDREAAAKHEASLNLDGLVRYRDALHRILDELGVPGEGYPAPVSNAVVIAREALSGVNEALAAAEGQP